MRLHTGILVLSLNLFLIFRIKAFTWNMKNLVIHIPVCDHNCTQASDGLPAGICAPGISRN